MAALIRSRNPRQALGPIRNQRGAEVVELAIVLPLLLFVFVGIIDFGFMFQRYAVLNNAAMEGARVGSLPGYQIPADVTARVNAYAATAGVNAATIRVDAVTVAVPAAGGGNWPAVQVTVEHDYTFRYIGGMAVFFGGSSRMVTLRARSVMRSQVGAGGG
jgi:Flp pilus assembly protein TadG